MARRNRKNNRNDHRLVLNRGVANLERAERLALGGQQSLVWRSAGIKASVSVDRRKRADKRSCRGRVSW